MSQNLFISYSHSDDKDYKWLERLKGFLDALQEQLPLRPWEDTMIPHGGNWRKSIKDALSESAAAILLVGRGFLASRFIKEMELPTMLTQKDGTGVRLYILYVGYCPWKSCVLEPYQAFNNPDQPLESLDKPAQNKWFNELVIAIQTDLLNSGVVETKSKSSHDPIKPMQTIKNHLETTGKAFLAQITRAQSLMLSIQGRLEIDENLQYEQFFFRFYDRMHDGEHFQFDQIRALTEGILFEENKDILQIIEQNPTLRDELPILGALKTHLIIWLNKYEKVFSNNKKMSVCFTGVEDGVPFPFGVDEEVGNWIETHRT